MITHHQTTNMQNPLQVYSDRGLRQKKGASLSESTGKFFDCPVNEYADKADLSVMKKGKRGGGKISRAIAMDYDTYHRTKGGLK